MRLSIGEIIMNSLVLRAIMWITFKAKMLPKIKKNENLNKKIAKRKIYKTKRLY